MKRPSIGLIMQEWGQHSYQNEALKLGIQIKCSSKEMTGTELIEFSQECDLICVDPKIVNLSAIKTAERAGIRIYPSSKTVEQLSQISSYSTEGECLSILVARSAHAQVASWPITLISEDLSITPAPGVNDEVSQEIQLSLLTLAAEVGLIGGFELLVDAIDYKKLIGINWITPITSYANQIGSVTSFYEQNLRAVLDLPLGSTDLVKKYVVTGKLETDPNSDNFRPYLHLMARNPKLKFDQSISQVGIMGDELEPLLTEIIHAQQYYSGKINE